MQRSNPRYAFFRVFASNNHHSAAVDLVEARETAVGLISAETDRLGIGPSPDAVWENDNLPLAIISDTETQHYDRSALRLGIEPLDAHLVHVAIFLESD